MCYVMEYSLRASVPGSQVCTHDGLEVDHAKELTNPDYPGAGRGCPLVDTP